MTVPHGGDLAAVARRFGRDPATLLDFSANVDPYGPPPAVLAFLSRALAENPRILAAYPPARLPELTARLAREHDVEPACVVVGNGTAALLDAVARASTAAAGVPAPACLIPQPAFGEYARAFALAGARTETCSIVADGRYAFDPDALLRALRLAGAATLVLTNPHNPTGALLSAASVRELHGRMRASGATLVLDEAFVDYAPEASLARDAGTTDGLVVLRSLTKFYATAGLRVGYLLATPAVAARIRAYVPPWPVGTLAAGAAIVALDDAAYRERTRAVNAIARATLAAALAAAGFRSEPASANFLLLRVPPGCGEAYERLIREHGVVTRECTSFGSLAPGAWLRVGVRTPPDNARLAAACAAISAAARASSS